MSGTPTVSVVIPTYNRAEWLPASVGSVLAQTVKPLEILIVDDGSTDNTQEVCAGFPAPVRYLRQENAGVSSARNLGMSEAKGDYVALLDSDDLWVPRKLEIQLAFHRSFPEIRWSATEAHTIDPEGRVPSGLQGFELMFALFGGLDESAGNFFDRWLTFSRLRIGEDEFRVWTGDLFPPLFFGNFVLPSSTLIHRDALALVGGFDESFRLAEETEFFHRLAAECSGGIIGSPLCLYRTGLGESLVSPANMIPLIRNAILSTERAAKLRSPLRTPVQKAYDTGRRRLLGDLAYAHLAAHDRPGARAAAIEAWRAGARTFRTVGIYLVALLPAVSLGVMHRMKRWRSR